MKNLFKIPIIGMLLVFLQVPAATLATDRCEFLRKPNFDACLELAKEGNISAQFDISMRYFTGTEGPKRNVLLAYIWAKLCSEKSPGTCGKLLVLLEKNMSHRDVSKAINQAIECLNSKFKKCG